MSVSISPTPEKPRRRLRLGLGISLVIHSCLLTALVVIPYRLYVSSKQGKDRAGETAGNDKGKGNSGGEKAADAPEVSRPTPEQAAVAEKVMTDRVDLELKSALSQAEQLSEEEKLARLKQLSEKLDRVASEKSVNELSEKFHAWLKTEGRATAPAEKSVAGEFDYGTAQFHDVKREELPEGGYRYKSVLLDAAGRTVEVEIDAAEGERTYSTLAILKSNPLAEKLYRQITMPLLDKLVKAAEQAATAAEPFPAPAPTEAKEKEPGPAAPEM